MNLDNLHELINRYEDNIDMLYNNIHNELFKWKAMKVWRDEWFKPEKSFESFAGRYNAAKREFSLFIDNSRMHPSTGVVKLWEKEPETVERLFCDVLFADTHGDVKEVQNNMDGFLEGYEALLQKYFPRSWSFKQDRHSASVFLAMNDPDFNFVFKSKEAQTMAKYTDFGLKIGSGTDFSLPNYYKLCEEIVAALKEHDSLLSKHFDRLTPDHYYDRSLHLLAFDLMYCCRTYDFYRGLTVASTGKTIRKKSGSSVLAAQELEQREAARLEKIGELEQRISDLERSCDEYADISLIGVQVTANTYGVGTVISQNINNIKVRFSDVVKTFTLDKKFVSRPRFENDEIIIEAFTEYGNKHEEIEQLKRKLKALQ